MRVESVPVQAFSASFELQGSAQQGALTLTSPLGTMLAQAQWSAQGVHWRTPGESRSFDSLDALTQQLTGTALPIAALFDWLHGTATVSAGWMADLSEFDLGRIRAQRNAPEPAAQLRIVLER